MRNRLMGFLRFIQEYMKGLHSSLEVGTPSPVSPSPVSPSPYQGEGELLGRGVSPLLDTPFFTVSSSPLLEGSFRGTKSLLHDHLPLSFEGEGD